MKAIELTDNLFNYLEEHAHLPHPALNELAALTHARSDGMMQISRSQGALMHFLIGLMNAQRALEIGCFTGYSAIAVARALPNNGELVTIDCDPDTMAIAKEYFNKAGVSDRITPKLGDARAILADMQASEAGSFDFAFIDADKTNYEYYFDHCLKLLRPGGLIAVDNVLWSGNVVNPADETDSTVALRAFNEARKTDQRIEAVMVNVADGIYLCRKL